MEKEIKVKDFPNLRTVYLTGEINEDSLLQFKKDLDALIKADKDIFNDNVKNLGEISPVLAETYKSSIKFPPIILDITSPGGVMYAGLALYDIIRDYNLNTDHKIIAKTTGLVASAATLVMLACDERIAGKNTTFLIHSIFTFMTGKLQDAEEGIAEIRRLSDVAKNIYTERTNITLKQLKEIDKLKKDWILTSEEALEHGLITKII